MKTAYRIPDTPQRIHHPRRCESGQSKHRSDCKDACPLIPDFSGWLCKNSFRFARAVGVESLHGYGGVARVEVSVDEGASSPTAHLDGGEGKFPFRTWELSWIPRRPGRYGVPLRARMEKAVARKMRGYGIRGDICGIACAATHHVPPPNEDQEVNSLRSFALVTAICAFFASAALYAQFNAGFYTLQEPGIFAGPYRQLPPRARPTTLRHIRSTRRCLLPTTASRRLVSYCNPCHSARYITMQPQLLADTWTAEVNKMAQPSGASIPEDATQKIIHYLQSHYTPENRKK